MKILTSLIAVALLTTAGATLAELRQGAYVIGASGGTITGGDISAMVVMGEPISGTVENGEVQMQAGFIPVWLYGGGILSAPEEPFRMQPETITLSNPYPNPFNSQATISYSLPSSRLVSLIIYDLSGRQISRLVNNTKSAGVHSVVFDANNLAAGVYIIRFQAGEFIVNQRLTFIK